LAARALAASLVVVVLKALPAERQYREAASALVERSRVLVYKLFWRLTSAELIVYNSPRLKKTTANEGGEI
jgi:hypothetical protein